MSRLFAFVPVPVVIVFFACAALFLIVPELDLKFHRMFFDAARGGFYLKNHPLAVAVYEGVPWITRGLVLVVLVSWALSEWKKRDVLSVNRKVAAYVLLVLAVGPGLLVNAVFKDHWGRARPSQIVEFGGEKQFTPAWVMTDQCERNCSFVSGHASIGFYLLAFALLSRKHRKSLLTLGVLSGLLVGWARVVQGGHFLSDVIFSGFVVYFTACILFALIRPDRKHIRILPYTPDAREAFSQLNLNWIEKLFAVEPFDREVLSKPEEYILSKGGEILTAWHNGKAVSVGALMPHGEEDGTPIYEVTKMATDDAYQGQGIGRKIMRGLEQIAREKGCKRLLIYSSRSLPPAIGLYQSEGYVEIPVTDEDKARYKRCNIKLEKQL